MREKLFIKHPLRVWVLRGGLAALTLPVFASLVMILGTKDILSPISFVGMFTLIGTLLTSSLVFPYICLKRKAGFKAPVTFVCIFTISASIVHLVLLSTLIMGLKISFTKHGFQFISIEFWLRGLLGWSVTTLPTSAFCGWVFWWVAVRNGK